VGSYLLFAFPMISEQLHDAKRCGNPAPWHPPAPAGGAPLTLFHPDKKCPLSRDNSQARSLKIDFNEK
jgi:hypothetical protein